MALDVTTRTCAGTLAAFARELRFDDIPPDVVSKAKQHLLDALGIAIASSAYPFGEAVAATARRWGGQAESTLVAFGDRLPAPSAAMVNGTLIHSLDYDDTHMGSIVHVSAPTVPAALAVGEARGASGREVLAALIASYEATIRIGLAAPGRFHDRGFHATPIAGVFGAALAAGRLLGLSEQQLTWALGIAGSQATGLQEFINDGTWVKRFHPGWAAHGGVVAAELASNGFTAPARVLEGRYGLYNVLLGPDKFDQATITAGLGSVWHTREITFKPYPCCHLLHAFIDAAIAAKREGKVRVEEIERIECRIPATPQHLLCEPLDAKYAPLTTYQAMFSLPYAVAVALLDERAGLRQFSEQRIREPQVLELARRVVWTDDPESLYPRYFSGYVKIQTRDGRTVEHRESYNRGCPENPLAYEDLVSKFRDNAEPVLGAQKADAVVRLVEQLDTLPDLSALAKALSRG